MARWLIELVRRHNADPRYYSVREPWCLAITAGSGDVPFVLGLRKLIESQPTSDTAKKTSGFWRPTDRGRRFVRGLIRIYDPVFVFNAKPIGFGDRLVSIRDALGKKFDYRKLLKGTL